MTNDEILSKLKKLELGTTISIVTDAGPIDAAYVGITMSNEVIVQLNVDNNFDSNTTRWTLDRVRFHNPQYVVVSDFDQCVAMRLEVSHNLDIGLGDLVFLIDDHIADKGGYVSKISTDPEDQRNTHYSVNANEMRIIKAQSGSDLLK